MFFTVYQTTNLINGRYYVGRHQSKEPNDKYIGSGMLLKLAIEKYGNENFKKVVLVFCDSKE